MQNETLGEYILAGRTACVLTRQELAERLRVTPRDISEWERNVKVPGRWQTFRLSRILKLPLRELYRLTPDHSDSGLFGWGFDLLLSVLPLLIGTVVVVRAAMGKADFVTGCIMLVVGIICIVINIRRRR